MFPSAKLKVCPTSGPKLLGHFGLRDLKKELFVPWRTCCHVGPILQDLANTGIGTMMPISSRSGGWHCAGSGAVVLALAWLAFWADS